MRETLSLGEEQLGLYENINLEQARQIGLLKEYAALLEQEAEEWEAQTEDRRRLAIFIEGALEIGCKTRGAAHE